MNVPPLLIGIALAFWGWQTGNLVIGALLGIALEALRALRLRIDLGVNEHSTIADLSTIGFVLLAVLLAANRGIGRGIRGVGAGHRLDDDRRAAADRHLADHHLPGNPARHDRHSSVKRATSTLTCGARSICRSS